MQPRTNHSEFESIGTQSSFANIMRIVRHRFELSVPLLSELVRQLQLAPNPAIGLVRFTR